MEPTSESKEYTPVEGGYSKPKQVRFRFKPSMRVFNQEDAANRMKRPSTSQDSPSLSQREKANPKQNEKKASKNKNQPQQKRTSSDDRSTSSSGETEAKQVTKQYMSMKQAAHQTNDCMMYVLHASLEKSDNAKKQDRLQLWEVRKTPNQIAQYLRGGNTGCLQKSSNALREFLRRNKKKMSTLESFKDVYNMTGIQRGKRSTPCIARTKGGLLPTQIVRRACYKPFKERCTIIRPSKLSNERYQTSKSKQSGRQTSPSDSTNKDNKNTRSASASSDDALSIILQPPSDEETPQNEKGKKNKRTRTTAENAHSGERTAPQSEPSGVSDSDEISPIFSIYSPWGETSDSLSSKADNEYMMNVEGKDYVFYPDTVEDKRTRGILRDAFQFAETNVGSRSMSDALANDSSLAKDFLSIPYKNNQLSKPSEQSDAYMGFARLFHPKKQRRYVGNDPKALEAANAILRLAKIAYTTVSGKSQVPDEPSHDMDDCFYIDFPEDAFSNQNSSSVLKRLLNHVQNRKKEYGGRSIDQILRMDPEEAKTLLGIGLRADEDRNDTNNLRKGFYRLAQKIHPDKLHTNDQMTRFCDKEMMILLITAAKIVGAVST